METIRWIIVALVTISQIAAIIRSERALAREIAAKDAALEAKDAALASKDAALAAKDEALRARDAQIEALRELTSVKVREHYQATKAQLEEYIDQLKSRIQEFESTSHHDTEGIAGVDRAELALVLQDALDATLEKIEVRLEQDLKATKKKLGRRGVTGDQATIDALDLLAKGPKGELEIIYERDDPEAFHFAQDLYSLLRATGWEANRPTPIPAESADSRPSSIVAGATNSDLTIVAGVLEDCGTRIDTPYCALVAGLQGFGLGLHMTRRDELPPNSFRIVIGPKW